MSFNSKEKVIDYMHSTLKRFKVQDYKTIAPEFFEMSASSLENEIIKRKLRLTKKNISEIMILQVKESNWDVNEILETSFELELEYLKSYSHKFEWTAYKFVGASSQGVISDINNLLRSEIRNDKKDALVMVKKSNNFFWISIIMKTLKKIGLCEKPRYFVLSADARYFFVKDKKTEAIIKYLTTTLGYKKEKKLKLSGRSLPSLIKLLNRKEEADLNNRPIYNGGEAVKNEFGIDFTQKQSYYDYFDKCVDNENDIQLQRYTVCAVKCPWLGDDIPCLRQMEFRSAITFKGDVGRIIKELPVASIVKPPLPDYLKNFSVKGENRVFIQ